MKTKCFLSKSTPRAEIVQPAAPSPPASAVRVRPRTVAWNRFPRSGRVYIHVYYCYYIARRGPSQDVRRVNRSLVFQRFHCFPTRNKPCIQTNSKKKPCIQTSNGIWRAARECVKNVTAFVTVEMLRTTRTCRLFYTCIMISSIPVSSGDVGR